VPEPEVRYVEREGKCLAYAIFGTGPVDLLVFQGSCPIDLLWDLPQLASFMDTLAEWARVIVWDPRGQGASDHIVARGLRRSRPAPTTLSRCWTRPAPSK
jgi:hypothetical protein